MTETAAAVPSTLHWSDQDEQIYNYKIIIKSWDERSKIQNENVKKKSQTWEYIDLVL